MTYNGDFLCEVAIPNKEISYVYNKEILQRFDDLVHPSVTIGIQEAMYSGDYIRLRDLIQSFLMETVSSFDTAAETFYHGLMLGLCVILSDAYITSNRESENGRYDIQIMPKRQHFPGILIELKAGKNPDRKQLKALADKAIIQIEEKRYEEEMRAKGIQHIYLYGIAFCGKYAEISFRESGKDLIS